MDLRDLFPPAGPAMRPAVIKETRTDGTVLVVVDGVTVPALVPDSIVPEVGNRVLVERATADMLHVASRPRTSNPATQTVGVDVPVRYRVLAAAPGVANPLVVSMAETRSWRTIDGWSRDKVYQGAYSASDATRWGYWRGCYFPGPAGVEAIAALRGRQCAYIRLRVHRASEGGASGATQQVVGPHVHATRPAGQPFFPVGAQRITTALTVAGAATSGDLAWGETKRLILPTAWGQGLLDGVYFGFGHEFLAVGSGNYSIGVALGSDAAQGQLEIGWV